MRLHAQNMRYLPATHSACCSPVLSVERSVVKQKPGVPSPQGVLSWKGFGVESRALFFLLCGYFQSEFRQERRGCPAIFMWLVH